MIRKVFILKIVFVYLGGTTYGVMIGLERDARDLKDSQSAQNSVAGHNGSQFSLDVTDPDDLSYQQPDIAHPQFVADFTLPDVDGQWMTKKVNGKQL